MATKTKMTFRLEKDEDGYPPDDFETLWVETRGDGLFRIDNIPFYVTDVSPDDIVSGREEGGTVFFEATVNKSKISVIRIIFLGPSKTEQVLQELVGRGCKWEGSHVPSLYSVEVPREADYASIIEMLDKESAMDSLDYEESSLRHQG